jgi:uncharacterized protein (TIGR03435 family)
MERAVIARKESFVAAARVAAGILVVTCSLTAQSGAPQWQIDAGGKMSFEVASVKASEPGDHGYRMNFPLTLGPNFVPVGNRMSVNVPLRVLIGFAYKLSPGQTRFLMPGLPNWVDSEWFEVEARASGNPTKDQFRLMAQSLLADRFALTVHHESRRLPIFALVLSRLGKTGPQLTPHTDDSMCAGDEQQDLLHTFNPGLPPFPCGSILFPGMAPSVPGRIKGGGRDLTLDYFAAFLTGFQGLGLDRPVMNQTGLGGSYDFWMELVRPSSTPLPIGVQTDPTGPTLFEALRDQLGLKVKATTGAVDVLVIDHIEEPSPN